MRQSFGSTHRLCPPTLEDRKFLRGAIGQGLRSLVLLGVVESSVGHDSDRERVSAVIWQFRRLRIDRIERRPINGGWPSDNIGKSS